MTAREPLLTVPELARLTKFSETGIRKWIRAGTFPGRYYARRGYRTQPEDFDAWVRGEWQPRQPAPASEPTKMLHRRAAS